MTPFDQLSGLQGLRLTVIPIEGFWHVSITWRGGPRDGLGASASEMAEAFRMVADRAERWRPPAKNDLADLLG